MDERRDRRGSGHGVGQPGVQHELADFDITAIVREAAATTSAVWLTPPWRMFSLIVIVSKVMPLPARRTA